MHNNAQQHKLGTGPHSRAASLGLSLLTALAAVAGAPSSALAAATNPDAIGTRAANVDLT